MRVSMSWRNVGLLSSPLSKTQSVVPFFNEDRSRKIFKLLGIAHQFEIDAIGLSPTSSYFQHFNSELSRDLQDKSAVEFTTPSGADARLNIPSHRVYSSAIGLVESNLEILIPGAFPVPEILKLRALNTNSHSPVGVATKAAFGCLEEYAGGGSNAVRYRGRPLHLLEIDEDQGTPSEFVRFNRVELTGLLIGNTDYPSMHEDIVNGIFDKCAELNKKTSEEYSLASKQGIVVVGRPESQDRRHASRGLFARSCACFNWQQSALRYYPVILS